MSEEEIKDNIEQIGYKEFYRYYEEKNTLIKMLQQENKELKEENKRLKEYVEYWQEACDKRQDKIFELLTKLEEGK